MRKLHEPIVSELIESIVSGAYAPGAVLPNETDLARSRGVSRTAAREAMQKLQALGLIDVKRRKGATALPRSAWNLLDPTVLDAAAVHLHDLAFFDALMEARLLIEPGAAQLAAERAGPQDLSAIEAAFAAMASEAGGPRSRGGHDADLAFHTSILDATGNWVLQQLGVTVRAALAASIRLMSQHAAAPEPSLRLHQNVFDAIAGRRASEAHAAMTWLLVSTRRDLSALAQRDARWRTS